MRQPDDRLGCARACAEQHTYRWGQCELAVDPGPPPLMVSETSIAEDGYLSTAIRAASAEELAAHPSVIALVEAATVGPDPELANTAMRAMLDAVKDLRTALTPPAAPDEQVRTWRLYSGEEYGGIYCAEPDCGCMGHGSEILLGGYPDDGCGNCAQCRDATGRFTLTQLHEAVAEHIAYRAERRAEEAEDQQ
jgi:hypothetical protein